jgi:hypothetical protein
MEMGIPHQIDHAIQ